MTGEELVGRLGLKPHPEGGWYRRTWQAEAAPGIRPAGSAIYYLLQAGEASRRHRIDATEVWHHCLGQGLELVVTGPDGLERRHLLGPDVAAGQRPQVVVPAWAWQRAHPLGEFALVGCTVSPAFQFLTFELSDAP